MLSRGLKQITILNSIILVHVVTKYFFFASISMKSCFITLLKEVVSLKIQGETILIVINISIGTVFSIGCKHFAKPMLQF